MKEIVVTHLIDGEEISLTISEATTRMGLLRTVIMEEAINAFTPAETGKEINAALMASMNTDRILAYFLYPALISSVRRQTGFYHWPLTLEEFGDLPAELEVKWEAATFELNPKWRVNEVEETEEEKAELRKKVMELTSSSENSTEQNEIEPMICQIMSSSILWQKVGLLSFYLNPSVIQWEGGR